MKINIFVLAEKSVVCLNSSQVLILVSLHCLDATPYATFIYYVSKYGASVKRCSKWITYSKKSLIAN